ncbi:pyridoxal phosphate-dependent aminotransferase [Hymenobacter properus]|uniref:Aminotransferase class I/II-fold pyridoxal phosphate-dependent enzyme n=1 Tax=Hymenobacter properus TaxID=2791026 RepID=A0A931FPY6_9BACT|nr:aminotransferase class I/II-fold pyridoxal phosphate-dependent enzyme [Hymenobacter properus]MBF9144074.1 aminotransferase class I/II-fold pyridoxal phosphate-dependent enzyme [Hymenobacter properus]MBR7722890.1 aminotransferase class I/II-fold pyridoxal phosphate-dependent enzyme [Microvirga sp. SRT04]
MTPISLASGYGNFAVPEVALAAASHALTDAQQHHAPLSVSPAAGLPVLREALAERYRQRGAAGVGAGQVVVTAGAKTGLFALLSELLQPGDEVLLPTPNWFGFFELVRRAGGTLRTLPLPAAGNYALTPDTLRAALTPATRLLIISNPNNPSGRVYSHAEWMDLLAVTAEFPQLWVLSDEIYEGISFGQAPVPTLLALPDPGQRHVVVSGFSKSLALAGWGVGCLVAPPALAEAVAARLFATGVPVPVPAQLAALAATRHADEIGAGLCAQLAPNRQLLLDALADLPGAPASAVPEGTYYVFADFTRFLATELPAAEASAQLVQRLAAAGVEVVDGATCGAPGFVRLSYAVEEAPLREAVTRLRQVLLGN